MHVKQYTIPNEPIYLAFQIREIKSSYKSGHTTPILPHSVFAIEVQSKEVNFQNSVRATYLQFIFFFFFNLFEIFGSDVWSQIEVWIWIFVYLFGLDLLTILLLRCFTLQVSSFFSVEFQNRVKSIASHKFRVKIGAYFREHPTQYHPWFHKIEKLINFFIEKIFFLLHSILFLFWYTKMIWLFAEKINIIVPMKQLCQCPILRSKQLISK